MWKLGERYRGKGKGILWIIVFCILMGCAYVAYILFSVYWS